MSAYKEDNYKWLKQSVESMLNQTEQDFLFLIVIDGPIEQKPFDYLTCIQKETENLCIFESTENLGLSSAMNFLIDHVLNSMPSVEYFFRMDADDISEKHRIRQQVEYLQEHKDISIVGSALVEVNEKGKVVGRRKLPQQHQEIYKIMPRRCAINHPTVCIRMDVFKEGFRYDNGLLNTQDYFLWIDLCAAGFKFANISESLLKFRRVNDFYKRRGLNKSINEFKARWHAMRSLNKVTVKNITYALLVIALRFMPSKLIKLAYRLDRHLMKRY